MEKKYTPGPWVWDMSCGSYLFLDSPHGTVLESFDDVRGGSTMEAKPEDAQLISAAPDLLEALVELMDCITKEKPPFSALFKSGAAIAKAYGRE